MIVDGDSLKLEKGLRLRPDQRGRRRQIDHRPGLDGLWPRRCAHHRRRGHPQSRRHLKAASRDCARCAAARFALSRSRPRPLSTRAPADGPGCRSGAVARRRGRAEADKHAACFKNSACRTPRTSAAVTRTRSRAAVAVSDDGHGPMLRTQPDRLDEPTSALDVTTQIDVLAAIKDAIRDTGVAAPLHYT